jgi:hypothetical protein
VTTGKLLIAITIVTGFLATCAQSEFTGDSGQGIRTKKPPVGPPATDVPGPTDTPGNNELIVDDSAEIKLVDADLTIDRLGDSAAWTNCVSAQLVGGTQTVQLGCNKGAVPTGVKIKLLTNTCNTLRLTLKTNGAFNFSTESANFVSSGAFSKDNKFIKGKGMHIIPNAANRSFTLETNDNDDFRWHDTYLKITPPANRTNIKFTIENSGLPCN